MEGLILFSEGLIFALALFSTLDLFSVFITRGLSIIHFFENYRWISKGKTQKFLTVALVN